MNTKTTSTLQMEIATSFESLEDRRDQWDAFVSRIDCDIYMSFDWCRVWWNFYGTNRDLRLFIFYRGERIQGIVPLFIDRVRLGIIRVRVAKLIGSEFTLNVCHPPVWEDAADDILGEILTQLIEKDKCDAVSFAPIMESHPFLGTDREDDLPVCRIDETIGPLTLFSVPESLDEYLASLSSNERAKYRKSLRRMEKEVNFSVEVISNKEKGLKEFDAFVAMHQKQWNDLGKSGHFGAWPDADQFHREVLTVQASQDRLRMLKMIANGKTIAYGYCYAFKPWFHGVLSARIFDESLKKYSIGVISLVKMLEASVDSGCRFFEAGREHYDYKIRMGGREVALKKLAFLSDRASSRLRWKLFQSLAKVYDILYYKIWIRRGVPKLGLKPRKLSQRWIRSHF